MEEQHEEQPSPRSDLISGGVWVVLGLAIMVGSWNMDRLEKQGVPAFAAPGLLPGILGVLITLSALAIVLRSVQRGAMRPAEPRPAPAHTLRLTALTLLLCLGFAVGLVGHGLPFWVAASSYLFLHIFLLQLPQRRAAGQVGRGVAVALAVGLGAGLTIATLFQYVFLVRLP